MQFRDILSCASLRDEFTTAEAFCGRTSRLNCGNTQKRARDAQQGDGIPILVSRILILLSCCMLLAFCGRISGATPTAAVITSPTTGSVLQGSTATFTWSAGSGGVTGYYLHVGTAGVGSANLVNIGPLSSSTTSATVTLPTNGATIYVQLETHLGGTILENNNTYTELTQSAAAITSPTNGSTLTGASTTFTWSASTGGVTGYYLHVGTAGVGSANLVNIGVGTSTSATVTLPANGATIYVQLETHLGGTILENNNTYTEFTQSAAAITSPTNGSTLTGASTTFTWSAGTGGVTGYYLHVGTAGVGSADLVNIGVGTSTSATVTLPTNGATIYVQLETHLGGTILENNNTNRAASSSPTLSGLSCASASMTVAGTDTCAVTLSTAALSGGSAISLASNNSAVAVPAGITVAAGATTANFTATVSTVSSAQTVTLTANANSAAKTFALQLGSAVATLKVNATTIAFGSVNLGTPATQTLILTSTGNAAVTVSGATVTGSGFTVSGGPFPFTLNPNQTATLNMQFAPTVAGAVTGQVTIASNSSTGTSAVLSLSGTGTATSYQVNLSWDAPTSSPDPVAGYNIYRAPSGVSSYTQLNSSVMSATTYVDSNVQNGVTYDYIVDSVDASGVTSVPSNTAAVSIP